MSTMCFRLVTLGVATLMTQACIVEAPGGSSVAVPSATSRPMPLRVPTASQVPIGANLGGKVEVTSVRVDPATLFGPGSIKVITEYRVLETFDVDWQIFVHVEDVQSPQERINVDHPPSTPTTSWKVGEIRKDEFTVELPSARSGQLLNVYSGFWEPVTNGRLPIQNPEKVKNDGNNRLLLAQVPVE